MYCQLVERLKQRSPTFFFGKGPQTLLWAGLYTVCVKITLSGIHYLLNYCVIFVVYTKFTDVAKGQIMAISRTPLGQCKVPTNGTLP
jgi:hypothetical protein